mgnify:CR=1 FL=1
MYYRGVDVVQVAAHRTDSLTVEGMGAPAVDRTGRVVVGKIHLVEAVPLSPAVVPAEMKW